MKKIYINTATRKNEFRWATGAPPNEWWSSYAEQGWIHSEIPGLIVRADEKEWSVYLTALPTLRSDRVVGGRPIRISFLFEGQSNDTDTGKVLGLIMLWLNDLGRAAENNLPMELMEPERSTVGPLIGEVFPEEEVQQLFDMDAAEAAHEWSVRVSHVLDKATNLVGVAQEEVGGSNLGLHELTIQSPLARHNFIEHVRNMLHLQQRGIALYCNLVQSASPSIIESEPPYLPVVAILYNQYEQPERPSKRLSRSKLDIEKNQGQREDVITNDSNTGESLNKTSRKDGCLASLLRWFVFPT